MTKYLKYASIISAIVCSCLAAEAQQTVVNFSGGLYIQTTNTGGQISLMPVTNPIVTFNSAQFLETTNAGGQLALSPVVVVSSPANAAPVVVPQVLPLVSATASPITSPTVTATGTPANLLTLLQSYALDNDPTDNIWDTNKLVLFQAAVFSSVNGTPGASAVGNDLGLELPIHKFNVHVESVTRFEQLFGDVHSQAIGVAYDYNLHQIQLSAGVDVEDTFQDNAVRAVPFLEFKKASTSLAGVSPLFRYEFPIQRNPGAGRVLVGVQMPLSLF